MHPLQLLVCGPNASQADFQAVEYVARTTVSAAETGVASLLQEDLATTEAVVVLDSRHEYSMTELSNELRQLELQPQFDALLIAATDDSSSNALLQGIPRAAAVLARNPLECGIAIVRRSAIQTAANAGERDCLLWEFLMQKANEGRIDVATSSSISPTAPERLPVLAPRQPSRRWAKPYLSSFDPADTFSKVSSKPDAVAFKAGLFQFHDFLDESHSLSQSVEGQGRNRAGDYWHAIMHRREGDYGNSKYWFRRVGQHPIFDDLARWTDTFLRSCHSPDVSQLSDQLLSNGWSADAFVDVCRDCAQGNSPEITALCERIQCEEMCLLLKHTCFDVSGLRT